MPKRAPLARRSRTGAANGPSSSFYEALGPTGLAAIAPELTPADLRWIKRLLVRRHAVLDAGCGYGRVAIPLAEAGHRVNGVDLDRSLIAAARRRIRGRGLPLRFAVGDIRELAGLADASCDAVICLWSTFQHLLSAADRRRCLAEFHRVLRPGGRLVLEMTDAGEPTLAARLAREGRGPEHRIASWNIHRVRIRCYLHDQPALERTLAASRFIQVRVATRKVRAVHRLVATAERAE